MVSIDEIQVVQTDAISVVASQVQFVGTAIKDKLKLDAEQAEIVYVVIRKLMRSSP